VAWERKKKTNRGQSKGKKLKKGGIGVAKRGGIGEEDLKEKGGKTSCG